MLVGTNCRKLFKKGKLTERQAFFGTVVIYEIQGLTRMERYFPEDEYNMKENLHNMLWYLFWAFEYEEGMILTARQISYLLGVDHTTVDRTIERIKYRVKNGLHLDLY